jgi:DNA-binding response OmpR family regulator
MMLAHETPQVHPRVGTMKKTRKTAQKKIVIVEDDANIASVLLESLAERGIGSGLFGRAEPFVIWMRGQGDGDLPDAVVLDLGLPDVSGMQILRRLHDMTPRIPFLVLSGWEDAEFRRECFKLGAADFVSKPFDLEEVMLRLERLLSLRLEREVYAQELLRLGSGFLHCQFKLLSDPVKGETNLSQMETKLLRKLVENKGQVVPRDNLFAEVWKYSEGAVSRTLDVYISRLRRILQQGLTRPPLIENLRGECYRLLETQETP